jgi:hypothetical protein
LRLGAVGSAAYNSRQVGRRRLHMSQPDMQLLRDRFLQSMLEATFPLQQGPDREVVLEALINAADRLRQRFEQELTELRTEEAE